MLPPATSMVVSTVPPRTPGAGGPTPNVEHIVVGGRAPAGVPRTRRHGRPPTALPCVSRARLLLLLDRLGGHRVAVEAVVAAVEVFGGILLRGLGRLRGLGGFAALAALARLGLVAVELLHGDPAIGQLLDGDAIRRVRLRRIRRLGDVGGALLVLRICRFAAARRERGTR